MPRNDDNAYRATAERINRSRSQWLVLWGCYSRLYWAFPLFETGSHMLLHSEDPDALAARMDEAERRFRVWPEQEG